MDKLSEMDNGQMPEIVDVVSVESLDEASTPALAEALAEGAVVVKPKRGLGLAAFFTRAQDTVEPVGEVEAEAAPDGDEGCEAVAPHQNGQLKSVLECMLFVSDGPMTAKQLATTLEIEECKVAEALIALEGALQARGGLQLVRLAGGYQLCTRPEYAEYCTLLLTPAKKRLSKAALETLAVVAYRQPCTLPEIEAVRGVAVDGVMKTIVERGLIKEAGRKQTPGRPILYATTPEFLEYFGLNDLSELPDIDMLAVEEVKALEAQRELFNGEAAESGEQRAESLEEDI